MPRRGVFNMYCWNGLSVHQQHRLIDHGNLPLGYEPGGWCPNPAELEIETMWDKAPGPRFYCGPCGLAHLTELCGEVKP